MEQPLNDILGEVAYLKQQATILNQHAAAIERDINAVGDVNSVQAMALAGGPVRMLDEAKLQIHHAIGCVGTWRESIATALNASGLR